MAIAAVSISPIGEGTSVARFVAEALRVVRGQSAVRFELGAMFTTLEVEPDAIFALVRRMQEAVVAAGAARVSTVLKMDDRRDVAVRMEDKVLAVKALLEQECGTLGVAVDSPADYDRQGGHVAFRHEHGGPLCEALIDAGVVGSFRKPAIVRFGLGPLYLSHEYCWIAIQRLRIEHTVQSLVAQQRQTEHSPGPAGNHAGIIHKGPITCSIRQVKRRPSLNDMLHQAPRRRFTRARRALGRTAQCALPVEPQHDPPHGDPLRGQVQQLSRQRRGIRLRAQGDELSQPFARDGTGLRDLSRRHLRTTGTGERGPPAGPELALASARTQLAMRLLSAPHQSRSLVRSAEFPHEFGRTLQNPRRVPHGADRGRRLECR